MELTLLLNATYEPLRVLNWQKAITLLWQGKVEVLEVYDREIHGVSVTIKLPSVIRLLKMIKIRDAHRSVKFSRINIFTRDGYRCQYCRRKYRTEDLTFDHVIPIAKGGKKTWENIVTAHHCRILAEFPLDISGLSRTRTAVLIQPRKDHHHPPELRARNHDIGVRNMESHRKFRMLDPYRSQRPWGAAWTAHDDKEDVGWLRLGSQGRIDGHRSRNRSIRFSAAVKQSLPGGNAGD